MALIVVAAIGLVPGISAAPSTAASVPIDPDNLNWIPPTGHFPVSQQLVLDWALGDNQAQAATGDGPSEEGNLRRVGWECSEEPKKYKRRNAAPDSENIGWKPEGDRDYGAPSTETYTLAFSAAGPEGGSVGGSISRSTPIYPGRVHPYPDKTLFHSSWITNKDDGAPSEKTIDVLGMNIWAVPQSAGGIHRDLVGRLVRLRLRLHGLMVVLVASLALPACMSEAKPEVIRVQRRTDVLDGGTPMRAGGRLCLADGPVDLGLRGCWEVHTLDSELDPQHDYFIWTFRGGIHLKGPRRVGRVKTRLSGRGAELGGWNPSADFEVKRAGRMDGSYHQPDITIDYPYDTQPGRIHPYPDAHLFHVSWLGSGKPITGDVEVGAVTVWVVPEGKTSFTAEATLEAQLIG